MDDYVPQIVRVSCEGKMAYPSMRLAKQIIRKRNVNCRQQPYKCEVCKQYHIGGRLKKGKFKNHG